MTEDPEPTVGWTEALGAAAANPPNPTAAGWTLFLKGEPHIVAALQNRHKAQFEQWVRGEALKAIDEARYVNESLAENMMSVYAQDFTNGHYKWDDNFDGKHVKAARQSPRGALHLLYLLMLTTNPKLAEVKALEVFNANSKGMALQTAYQWALGNWQAPVAEEKAGAQKQPIQLTEQELAEVMAKRQQAPAAPKTMDGCA